MLRVSEHYVSAQGEGPRVGQMTQFLRFAGCNMRCPGWPCDTQHAIEPSIWRVESKSATADDLILDVLDKEVKNVCLTGGEPFGQKNDDLQYLVSHLRAEGHTIEAFTNGSFLFPTWAVRDVYIVLDWKLGGSGEQGTNRSNRVINALNLDQDDVIKFTVADMDDLLEAKDVYYTLRSQKCEAQFYVGTVWGKFNDAYLVEWLIKEGLDWKLNVQVHKYIWSPSERGV